MYAWSKSFSNNYIYLLFCQISGPPGCGKTQFCIMLSVVSALPKAVGGRGSPVIYIDTEGAFSAERLVCMCVCVCVMILIRSFTIYLCVCYCLYHLGKSPY